MVLYVFNGGHISRRAKYDRQGIRGLAVFRPAGRKTASNMKNSTMLRQAKQRAALECGRNEEYNDGCNNVATNLPRSPAREWPRDHRRRAADPRARSERAVHHRRHAPA